MTHLAFLTINKLMTPLTNCPLQEIMINLHVVVPSELSEKCTYTRTLTTHVYNDGLHCRSLDFNIDYFFFSSISSKHNYNTRLASKSTYYVDHVRTNYGKFNLHFSGPSIWNNLDKDLKSLHSFKQTMTKQFLTTYA